MSRVRCSAAARLAARFTAVVVFPTPPFWFAMAMMRAIIALRKEVAARGRAAPLRAGRDQNSPGISPATIRTALVSSYSASAPGLRASRFSARGPEAYRRRDSAPAERRARKCDHPKGAEDVRAAPDRAGEPSARGMVASDRP